MKPIISFRDFSFQYYAQSSPTLRHINLDIYPGEKVLIAGPSGSGKSTLGCCINGLIPEAYPGTVSGTLTVNGTDTAHAGIFDLSAHVGTVLQDPDGQFIGLTVGEDIAFSLENDCTGREEMHKAVNEAAASVNVEKLLDMAPHELSGGQKQRVSLAGVLVNRAPILLFDEPLANLDPATGKQTIELIDRLAREKDATVLIIEHRLEDVLWRQMDRIILIADGQIAADMKPDELMCTDVLKTNGIREPLYLTAMRYAGLQISAEQHPACIHTLDLPECGKAAVREWFRASRKDRSEEKAEAALEVRDLCFGYTEDRETLHSVSFTVRRGEMVSIVGKNGAGKSTLAKLICGFETPSSGSILLNGKDITADSIRRRARQIGYVMQNPNQMISKTMIRDEVSMGLRGSGLSEDEIREKTDRALQICGLYPFRNWPVSALSFGQKKRVTVASVLVMGPDVIILDEPTAGQDFRHYTEIMEFLQDINRKGVTVIMITHDMHLMLEYTSRAIVIVDGRVTADSTPAGVLCNSVLTEKAALKETSLFNLAQLCGIDEPVSFVDCFIQKDREVRN